MSRLGRIHNILVNQEGTEPGPAQSIKTVVYGSWRGRLPLGQELKSRLPRVFPRFHQKWF